MKDIRKMGTVERYEYQDEVLMPQLQQDLKQAREKIAELEKINDVQRESIWQVIFGEPELMDKCVGALQIKKQSEEIEVIKAKLEKVLAVCKGHENLMWSAKIISIILDCDFRDSKEKLNSITIDSIKRGENER